MYNITLSDEEVAENKMIVFKALLLLLRYTFREGRVMYPPWPDCQSPCEVLS